MTIERFVKNFNLYLAKRFVLLITVGTTLAFMSCAPQAPERPDFSAISSPQLPVLTQVTATAAPTSTPESLPGEAKPTATGPTLFQMSPTKVMPTISPSLPTDTPTPSEALAAIEPTPSTTPVVPTSTQPPTPKPVFPTDEPRRGGSWDMEDGFEVWNNPYGDDCSGARVAIGWQGFTSRGEYGSSCFVLNEYAPNVFSGRYSQHITFDFVDSHAGLYRTFDTRPGHKYQVIARLRHVHTLPAMQFHFGYDLTGDTNWQADTVQWVPWDEFREDEWITHEEIFVATGPKTTIYIKGFHDTASQGGATYVDAVEAVDLGSE